MYIIFLYKTISYTNLSCYYYDYYYVYFVSAYLDKGGVNVLVVDWKQLAVVPCYPTATLNTGQVGRCVGEMLSSLTSVHGPDTLHLIGFSLGAHIAAYASNYLQAYTNRSVYRITGTDVLITTDLATSIRSIVKCNTFDVNDQLFVSVTYNMCTILLNFSL